MYQESCQECENIRFCLDHCLSPTSVPSPFNPQVRQTCLFPCLTYKNHCLTKRATKFWGVCLRLSLLSDYSVQINILVIWLDQKSLESRDWRKASSTRKQFTISCRYYIFLQHSLLKPYYFGIESSQLANPCPAETEQDKWRLGGSNKRKRDW